ncbi:Gp37Gp68 family protein [Ruminiclostridium papyrosolvens DSM 2782]|uniref:Gp37Gp68 family protein n=1 Tax=Ruminiclostridium papyrosolvens DSM 2782 TaxID=588581 RepID=F1TED4_9FIRM|nr:DUF5131 family protein [Ruminiclostridium papyrosolvens]EGD47100.1 Gp37Gp68 family protein [Ruminiclostridium papyrosolvens DSM 2782]WES36043.1 DUF5131 family protein [Ruminiclostridium papyrosolvens DSM 2782]WES36141.1 DUF5131 family protein [Ruminiclostridium papyrosolvens DSM 2782]
MNKSKIEWCDSTWNPVTGCLHGCDYCYAKRIAERFGQVPCENGNCNISGDCEIEPSFNCKRYLQYEKIHDLEVAIRNFKKRTQHGKGIIQAYPYGFDPTFHKYRLLEPSQKTKPQNIFVVSMGDLFGDWVPDSWIDEVFQASFNADHHRYLFLTKNPSRYKRSVQHYESEYNPYETENWDNIWFGTTINSQKDERRVVELLNFDEGHKFLSIEPLLGEIDLTDIPGLSYPGCTTHDSLEGKLYHLDDDGKWTPDNKIEWVIVGAETGPGAKPPEPEWVQSIIDQCRDAGIPLFLKNNLNWPMKIQEYPWEKEKAK